MEKIAKIALKPRTALDGRILWLTSLCRLDAIDLELLRLLTSGSAEPANAAERLGVRERTVRERVTPGAPLYDWSLVHEREGRLVVHPRIARFLTAA
jgi:hypothetical protein